MTQELLNLIRKAEELRLKVYLCPAGYPTIGYGHRVPDMQHPDITTAQAEDWLLSDVNKAELLAAALAPNLMKDCRRLAALTDLVFNVGISEALRTSGTVRALKAGDWPTAANKFVKWDHLHNPKTGVLEEAAGLKRRRLVGAEWIRNG